jgi:hypothetical protein
MGNKATKFLVKEKSAIVNSQRNCKGRKPDLVVISIASQTLSAALRGQPGPIILPMRTTAAW